MKDRTADVSMIIDRWYRIRHRAKHGRYDHLSVMRYLGVKNGRGPITHRFDARPVAGIKTLPHNSIISVKEVTATTTPLVNGRWVFGRPNSQAAK